ncbi:pre-mRNA-splicing factor SYF1 [Thamnocephalis sphaerospora]|uniref:Pre-mRNA-splicing factor SYF1 n=1 Tax=Thamnocephalis sphaerospora TaxID=78915 RepID=A0A4P9XWD3_9FUNG|nr:pre-mRNA-splicing factor SYF1 [Thamnocephalis sphaerospora]|eukprot:RKP09740.1 pre-mRNA-splicing factor SYF1 [Thamnocephalis sphaerospora]
MPAPHSNSGSGDADRDRVCNELLYMITPEDIPYEEDLLRQPYTLRSWLRYVEHKKNAPLSHRFLVYERAVKELPGSYKLWKAYLDLRCKSVAGLSAVRHAAQLDGVVGCFERALVLLHKMPRIWTDYCEFLVRHLPHRITQIRRTFDRALRALPITQHDRVWELYLKFAQEAGGATAIAVFRRYIKLEPTKIEDYIELLVQLDRFAEAVERLAQVCNDAKFRSMHGKSQYQLWTELADLCCEHPREVNVKGVRVEQILRAGAKRFSDQAGKIWCSLARYWIKLGQFEKARNIFEEGIVSVMTVRDFTQIFDAYAEFEESVISSKMEAVAAQGGEPDPASALELDLRLARFERLMDRRPFLVNDVLLRQNPNNVSEWQKRVSLCKDDMEKVVETYTKALATVQPKKAYGKLHQLWCDFAQFYEEADDLDNARRVFEKATRVDYRAVNDLADIWCEWAEMELRHGNYADAVEVMARATVPPANPNVHYKDETVPVQRRIFKSLRLWSFYVDLEESIGTIESARAVYDRILQLRIATPQIIVNYAAFLEEHQYFEESFKVYERGIGLFGYPVAFELWNIYLSKFIARYGGQKLERARDLFEQALEKCPAKHAKPLYLLYGRLEEEHGLAKNAMRIYDRATGAVTAEDRLEMYRFYIAKVGQTFGVTATREIYQRAIEALSDRDAKDMCLSFAEMERKLGEIDRARAIYAYASAFCDPRTVPSFWQQWHDFEVKHGNEDTFKEMLRIKRSVQLQFNTEVNYLSAQLVASREKQQLQGPAGFVAATKTATLGASTEEVPVAAAKSADASQIELDLDDDDDDE